MSIPSPSLTEDQLTTWREICHAVLRFAPSPYAKSYAQAGLSLTSPEAVRVQALYISTNVTSWRGERARATKYKLKEFLK